MVIKCMYCGIIIDVIGKSEGVSHGVCSDCLPSTLEEMEISLSEYIESMPFPAVLVSENGQILAKNSQYRQIIKVDPHAIEIDLKIRRPNEDHRDISCDSAITKMVKHSKEVGRDTLELRTRADLGANEPPSSVEVMIGAQRIGRNYIIGIEHFFDNDMS